jgi:hypothetical protein
MGLWLTTVCLALQMRTSMPGQKSSNAPCRGSREPLRDGDIRTALVARIRRDDPDATIFHELPLRRGSGRADVVAVNGAITGYEIKSDRDSLARIKSQHALYDETCQYVTIVLTAKHVSRAKSCLPRSWGICVAVRTRSGTVRIHPMRKAKYNRPSIQVLVKQLWKTECIKLLTDQGVLLDRCTPVREVWRRMELLPEATLATGIRLALKQRRPSVDRQLARYGD